MLHRSSALEAPGTKIHPVVRRYQPCHWKMSRTKLCIRLERVCRAVESPSARPQGQKATLERWHSTQLSQKPRRRDLPQARRRLRREMDPRGR